MTALKILVVDDSPTMRELLCHAVGRLPGAEAHEATDGCDALGRLDALAPDCIVVDINMPVMDGLTFLQRVRGSTGTASVPIVVVTTEDGVEDRARALELGASAVVTKPLRAPKVLAALREVLGLGR